MSLFPWGAHSTKCPIFYTNELANFYLGPNTFRRISFFIDVNNNNDVNGSLKFSFQMVLDFFVLHAQVHKASAILFRLFREHIY